MSLAWSRRVALGVFALAGACNGGNRAAPGPPAGGLDAGLHPAAKLKFDVDPGLACANGQGICVAPSQVVTFGVEGDAGTAVTLSLEGDYADAALTTQTLTLAGGRAQVTLESASTTATFSIVARVGGAASTQPVSLPVTVSQSGTATVQATPSYAGHRPTPELYAADFVLSTCAEITTNPADASALAWTAGPSGVAIALTVPAGERVAVDVRIGHYAFGCADVDPLVPQAAIALPVVVYDVPMALGLTNLNATFSFTPDAGATSAWHSVAASAVARIEAAFFGATKPTEAGTLLDAMRSAIGAPADQSQFDTLRTAGGWDGAAATWMSSHAPSIKTRAATWLASATSDGIGPLALNIGAGTGLGTAPVTVSTFAGLSWVSAGVSQPALFQWTADPNDTVHLSGAIDLASTPLLAHEADGQAAAAVTGATDLPSAIALGIDCTGLASSLVGSGVSYGTCGAACTASLCGAALSAAWKSVTGPAGNGADVVHATITASAPAEVGDLAEPAYVQGGWIGSVSGAGVPTAFPITGTLLATEPPPSP